MNELDAKLIELEKITDNDKLLEECIDLLLNLQKDFNHAIMSKDADILILEDYSHQKDKQRIALREDVNRILADKDAIIKYLEGKLDATFN